MLSQPIIEYISCINQLFIAYTRTFSLLYQLSITMESRSYMFSTAKKRSTLLESKGIQFPREDSTAPRVLISKKECPEEFQKFTQCLEVNSNNPEKCAPLKEDLFTCGRPGFKKANTDKAYVY